MTSATPAWIAALPTVNAVLNGTCALLLLAGWRFILQRRVEAHRACMLAAFGVSTVFLASYLTLHAVVGSTPFPGRGWIRAVYLAILISHATLAAAVVPLAIVTLLRGLRGRYEAHRRIARWTLPVWLYVSVTGVVVYVMLYHVY